MTYSSFSRFALTLITLLAALPHLQAQSRVDIANMQQDVELLRQEVGQLRLQVQDMQRVNNQLTTTVNFLLEELPKMQQQQQDALIKTDSLIADLRAEMKANDKATREELIAKVSNILDDYNKQVSNQLKEISTQPSGGSSGTTSSNTGNELKTHFPDNFPKTGIEYVVQPGDSLWTIASKNGSKVDWIENANKIANAKKLMVGDKLFVPIKQ